MHPFSAAALVVLGGCVGSPTDPPVDTDAPSDTDLTEPPPDLPAMTASVQQAVNLLPDLSMKPCSDAYSLATADRDETCPAFLVPLNWDGACLTDGGTSYFGNLLWIFDLVPFVEANLLTPYLNAWGPSYVDGYETRDAFSGLATGAGMDGTAVVTTPDETEFVFGGAYFGVLVTDQGFVMNHNRVEGLCRWGDDLGGTWVDQRIDPWIRITQMWPSGGDDRHLEVTGTVAGLTGAYNAVDFDITMIPPGLGGPCAIEPAGTIDVRALDGRYYQVTFEPTASCDGCGTVERLGTEMGQVCATFAPLLQPMSSPANEWAVP